MSDYNKRLTTQSKEKLNRFKMETGNEIGFNLKFEYNGELTSKESGSIGGTVVKKMVQSSEEELKWM